MSGNQKQRYSIFLPIRLKEMAMSLNDGCLGFASTFSQKLILIVSILRQAIESEALKPESIGKHLLWSVCGPTGKQSYNVAMESSLKNDIEYFKSLNWLVFESNNSNSHVTTVLLGLFVHLMEVGEIEIINEYLKVRSKND